MSYWSRLASSDITVDGTDDRQIWKSGATAGFRIGQCVDSEHELTGKAYFEVEAVDVDGTPSSYNASVGVGHDSISLTLYVGGSGAGNGWGIHSSGNVWAAGTVAAYLTSWSTGDIIMIAIDVDSGKIWYGLNGSWTGSPSAGTDPQVLDVTVYSDSVYISGGAYAQHAGLLLKAASDEQTYTPPTGFSAVVAGTVADENNVEGTLPEVTGRFFSGAARADGHWPLDVVEEGETLDIEGTNDATVSNMTIDEDGVLSSCLLGGFIGGSVVRNVTFGSPIEQLESFSFRFKPDASSNILFEGFELSGLGVYVKCDLAGYINFHVNPSSNTYLSSPVTLDVWHHICFVAEGETSSRVYVDGVDAGSVAYRLKQVTCMGYSTTYTSSYVPPIDDVRCSDDQWTAWQVAAQAALTEPDYSGVTRLEASLPSITGDFEASTTSLPTSAEIEGTLSEVEGSFIASNRQVTFNADLPIVTGNFNTGPVLDARLSVITGAFSASPGISASFGGSLQVVTGKFSTGPVLHGGLDAVTGSFTLSVGIVAKLDGRLPIVKGSFSASQTATVTLAGTLPLVQFKGKATVHPLGTISSTIPTVTGLFGCIVGSRMSFQGKLQVITGKFSAYNTVTEMDATLQPVEGEFMCFNTFDHGILINQRGQVR